MSICLVNENGIHRIRKGPWIPPKEALALGFKSETLIEWKKDFQLSDQFCQDCGEAIW